MKVLKYFIFLIVLGYQISIRQMKYPLKGSMRNYVMLPLPCNVLKKSDTLIPSITSSGSILLFSRNESLNANASVNSLLLRRGKADKMCVARFNALHICVSHAAMLQKVSLGQRLSVANKTACKTIRRYCQRYD